MKGRERKEYFEIAVAEIRKELVISTVAENEVRKTGRLYCSIGRSETWGLNLKLTKSQTDKVMSKAVRMGNAANSTCPIYRSDS